MRVQRHILSRTIVTSVRRSGALSLMPDRMWFPDTTMLFVAHIQFFGWRNFLTGRGFAEVPHCSLEAEKPGFANPLLDTADFRGELAHELKLKKRAD